MPKYTLFYTYKGESKEYGGESDVKLDAVTLLSKALPGTFLVPDKYDEDSAPTMREIQERLGYGHLRVVWHDS